MILFIRMHLYSCFSHKKFKYFLEIFVTVSKGCNMNTKIIVNNRVYPWPVQPVVVVCLDGCNLAYLEAAAVSGSAPFLASLFQNGQVIRARSAMPSLTNPNNISIVTGVPPKIHGISGNYVWDSASGAEVMLNDPVFMRAPTILAEFSQKGAKVVAITAKDKLRALLGYNMRGICFSAEKASDAALENNGICDVLALTGLPQPEIYSAAASEFVLAAGARILETSGADLMYLSTTDCVQHRYAPGTPQSNEFFRLLDPWLKRIAACGVTLILTADHGMNPKTDAEGTPNITFLLPILENTFGIGHARIVLPITDPYIAHHGSLGSFAAIYLEDTSDLQHAKELLRSLPGVEEVLEREEACVCFDLPWDRTGDLVVVSAGDWVLGRDPEHHDLSLLLTPLRSHGGIHEWDVPLLCSRSVPVSQLAIPHNYDAFWLGCNSCT